MGDEKTGGDDFAGTPGLLVGEFVLPGDGKVVGIVAMFEEDFDEVAGTFGGGDVSRPLAGEFIPIKGMGPSAGLGVAVGTGANVGDEAFVEFEIGG